MIGFTSDIYYFYRDRKDSALHRPLTVDNLQLFDAYDEMVVYVKRNYSTLLLAAYKAYADRVFDCLAKLKGSEQCEQIFAGLQEHIKKYGSVF